MATMTAATVADTPSPELTIIMPAHNEAARLPITLTRLAEFLAGRSATCEVLVVDDGSTDDTARLAAAAADSLPLRVLTGTPQRGKGYALRQGVAAARGATVLLCDADLPAPLTQLDVLQTQLAAGADVAIGSRDLPTSRLDPPQPRIRRAAAGIFRTVRRRFLVPQFRDTQCGFKLFRGPVARDVFGRCREDGWFIDCEALALACRLGYDVREVGITWGDVPGSKVRPLMAAWQTLPALLRIRRRIL